MGASKKSGAQHPGLAKRFECWVNGAVTIDIGRNTQQYIAAHKRVLRITALPAKALVVGHSLPNPRLSDSIPDGNDFSGAVNTRYMPLDAVLPNQACLQ